MSKPYLTDKGTLVIPMDVDRKYKWWVWGGQSLEETLKELGASQEIIDRYVQKIEEKKS